MQSAPSSSQNFAFATESTLAKTPTRTLSSGCRLLIIGRIDGSDIVTASAPASAAYPTSRSRFLRPERVNSRLSMHAGLMR